MLLKYIRKSVKACAQRSMWGETRSSWKIQSFFDSPTILKFSTLFKLTNKTKTKQNSRKKEKVK